MNKEKTFKENRFRAVNRHDSIAYLHDVFPAVVISPHWHSYYELELLIGSGETVINGKKYTFDKATMHIMSPRDIHSIKFDNDFPERYDVVFNISDIDSEVIRNYLLNIQGGFIPITDDNINLYISLFYRIEYFINKTAKKEYTNHLIKTLELLIMEFVNFSISPKDANFENKSDKSNLKSALSYMHKNFRKDIKLKDVANSVYLSEKYFSNFFRKEMNCSFSDYLTKLRIDNACHMLSHTNDTISLIAQDSGFKWPNHFHYTFKKITGLTPKEYRKKNREA